MKLKKIENPWDLKLEELQSRCVKVKTADGVMRDIGFHFDGGYFIASVYANPGMIEVRRCGWHLLGWTFYEAAEPLVWEGECWTGPYGYSFAPKCRLKEAIRNRKFRVVATEIVEDEE